MLAAHSLATAVGRFPPAVIQMRGTGAAGATWDRAVTTAQPFRIKLEGDGKWIPRRARKRRAMARALGATGVPFFVIDRRYGISGAQPADVIAQVLDRAWAGTQSP